MKMVNLVKPDPIFDKELNESDRPRSKKMDDQEFELVRKTQAGDSEAFGKLVEKYQGKIYALAYHMTGNHSDADDLAQEAFLKAWRAIGRFRFKSSFYTWVYRIALNTIITARKKSGRHSHLELNPQTGAIGESSYVPSALQAENGRREHLRGELQKDLQQALNLLSEKHRAVVVMHEIEGLTHREIARVLRCSEGTVRSRLHYARGYLQGRLKRWLE